MNKKEIAKLDETTVPFFPDHIGLEAKVALVFGIFMIFIGIIGLFNPMGLQAPADPMDTPAHVKPEWYFLALYQVLKFIPKGIGASLPVILVGSIFIWPFLDHKPDKSRNSTRNRSLAILIILVVFVLLTVWGELS
jgi:cytochrome b6-f complex subunit 4